MPFLGLALQYKIRFKKLHWEKLRNRKNNMRFWSYDQKTNSLLQISHLMKFGRRAPGAFKIFLDKKSKRKKPEGKSEVIKHDENKCLRFFFFTSLRQF